MNYKTEAVSVAKNSKPKVRGRLPAEVEAHVSRVAELQQQLKDAQFTIGDLKMRVQRGDAKLAERGAEIERRNENIRGQLAIIEAKDLEIERLRAERAKIAAESATWKIQSFYWQYRYEKSTHRFTQLALSLPRNELLRNAPRVSWWKRVKEWRKR